jgi:hypothetical protein
VNTSLTCVGSSAGSSRAKGWTTTANGMALCFSKSLLYGTMLSVQRINRGLALPVSRTTKRACVVGGLGYWFPEVRYSSGASPLAEGRGT